MSYNPFTLEGKTILITGASSGIGKSTAIECSKMGARVIITGRNADRLKETFDSLDGDNHQIFAIDLVSENGINDLIEFIPSLDGAVLSAGIGRILPIKFSSIEKFEEIYKTNLFAQTELTRQLIKKKKILKGGSIVFISSMGGSKSFNPGNMIYGTSKAALNSFMKFCSIEFSHLNIRFNSICPGMVETPLIRKGTITEEQYDIYKNQYALKRFGKPEEIAYGAIYLLSNASAWITGFCLFIDGGMV